jgi:hypothetical protein
MIECYPIYLGGYEWLQKNNDNDHPRFLPGQRAAPFPDRILPLREEERNDRCQGYDCDQAKRANQLLTISLATKEK